MRPSQAKIYAKLFQDTLIILQTQTRKLITVNYFVSPKIFEDSKIYANRKIFKFSDTDHVSGELSVIVSGSDDDSLTWV